MTTVRVRTGSPTTMINRPTPLDSPVTMTLKLATASGNPLRM